MLLARYRQTTQDLRRYIVDLDDWLADGETITVLDVTGPEAVTIENVAVIPTENRSFQLYLGGGTAGSTHRIACIAETSEGQIRADHIELIVQEFVA